MKTDREKQPDEQHFSLTASSFVDRGHLREVIVVDISQLARYCVGLHSYRTSVIRQRRHSVDSMQCVAVV